MMVLLHIFVGRHFVNGLHYVVYILNFWTTHLYQRCYFVSKVLQNSPFGIEKCIIWSRPSHKNSPGIILELSFFLQRAMCVFVVFTQMHLFSLNIVLATLHYRIATLKFKTVKQKHQNPFVQVGKCIQTVSRIVWANSNIVQITYLTLNFVFSTCVERDVIDPWIEGWPKNENS